MYFRKKTSGGRVYLQIAESRRVGGRVRQRVIATLGRLDALEVSGQMERLLRSGARFAARAMVLTAARDDPTAAVRRLAPALVFERLWAETGCRAVIEEVALKREHDFALERAIFLTVLHRLMGGGADLAAVRWRADYRIAGVAALQLHHLDRAMAWLGEELPAKEQDARTPQAPRCTKDLIEERLFAHRRDLFSRLDLVFMDTTSLDFAGAGGQTLGRHGYSKDHRPELCQMILAVLIDGDGRPLCSELWPGDTADVTTLVPVIERLRPRFALGRICVVADRGMISAASVAVLEERKLLYLLATRERTDQAVRDVVLADPAPYVPLTIAKRGQESDYEAKAVTVGGARYIVCRHHREAEKDAADRAAILAKLEQQLKKGDKGLVGNTGFRRFLKTGRFLKTEGHGHFAIDTSGGGRQVRRHLRAAHQHRPRAARRHAPLQAAVDRGGDLPHGQAPAGDPADLPQARRDHPARRREGVGAPSPTSLRAVFCSFLALVLKSELEQRIGALGRDGAWPEIRADLDSLTETELVHDGRRFLVRAAPRPAASLALRAAGVALPPTVQALAEA